MYSCQRPIPNHPKVESDVVFGPPRSQSLRNGPPIRFAARARGPRPRALARMPQTDDLFCVFRILGGRYSCQSRKVKSTAALHPPPTTQKLNRMSFLAFPGPNLFEIGLGFDLPPPPPPTSLPTAKVESDVVFALPGPNLFEIGLALDLPPRPPDPATSLTVFLAAETPNGADPRMSL